MREGHLPTPSLIAVAHTFDNYLPAEAAGW
jgi:hypothetical protein